MTNQHLLTQRLLIFFSSSRKPQTTQAHTLILAETRRQGHQQRTKSIKHPWSYSLIISEEITLLFCFGNIAVCQTSHGKMLWSSRKLHKKYFIKKRNYFCVIFLYLSENKLFSEVQTLEHITGWRTTWPKWTCFLLITVVTSQMELNQVSH